MSGLVAYSSSDEEDDTQEHAIEENSRTLSPQEHPGEAVNAADSSESVARQGREIFTDTKSDSYVEGRQLPGQDQSTEHVSPLVGPVLGPSIPAEESIQLPLPDEGDNSAPQSPYSANRALLRQLTVPPIPNLDIPPSPPRSPPPSTNAKFAHFLQLKKQGIHFNEKLSKSTALKNPSLMQKLMDFAEIDQADQYTSTLSEKFWNPKAFPSWAYKEGLAKSQQQVLKKKEEEKLRGQRESVDFVPATVSVESGKNWPTGSTNGRGGAKSATERVMTGLERPKSQSPHVQAGMKRKTRFES